MAQPLKKPGQPPVFERIGIVGLGLIGGSIALAARDIWPAALVIGVDRKDVLERAMVLHAIDVAADDLIVLAEADLVILATPIQVSQSLLLELPDNITGAAVITDTGSTKRQIVEAAKALPERLTFVGGHPLGGAARGGIDNARPDLFAERPWMFTPSSDRSGAALEKLEAFVTALGSVPRILTPAEHDHLLAFISHLPQLTASALMQVVGDAAGRRGLELSGRGLLDTTRLASSPADIWKEVCATNQDEIGSALDGLISALTALRADLAHGDAVDRTFEAAHAWREALTSRQS